MSDILLSDITDRELALEAKRRGYRMTKEPEKIKFLPCVCGGNRRSEWYSTTGRGWKYECNKCKLTGGWGDTKKDAKIAWNSAIEVKRAGEEGE